MCLCYVWEGGEEEEREEEEGSGGASQHHGLKAVYVRGGEGGEVCVCVYVCECADDGGDGFINMCMHIYIYNDFTCLYVLLLIVAAVCGAGEECPGALQLGTLCVCVYVCV